MRGKILLVKPGLIFLALLFLSACATLNFGRDNEPLLIPYIKNSPNECYYLDEFMPIANNMVTGKSGSLNLRYYTYNKATYKDWRNKNQIVLAFYSKDGQCWSLYEEYFVND